LNFLYVLVAPCYSAACRHHVMTVLWPIIIWERRTYTALQTGRHLSDL